MRGARLTMIGEADLGLAAASAVPAPKFSAVPPEHVRRTLLARLAGPVLSLVVHVVALTVLAMGVRGEPQVQLMSGVVEIGELNVEYVERPPTAEELDASPEVAREDELIYEDTLTIKDLPPAAELDPATVTPVELETIDAAAPIAKATSEEVALPDAELLAIASASPLGPTIAVAAAPRSPAQAHTATTAGTGVGTVASSGAGAGSGEAVGGATGAGAGAGTALPSGGGQSGVYGEDEVDHRPVLTHRVEPRYPARAQARDQEGSVQLVFLVDPDGHVSDLQVTDGERVEVFGPAATTAVRNWRFTPGRKRGEAVTTRVRVRIQFKLN